MKKVLIIQDDLDFGGMESFVLSLCNNIIRDESCVTLLLLSNDRNRLLERLDKRVKVIELPYTMNYVMNTWHMIFLTNAIRKVIKSEKPAIIHTNSYQLRLISIQTGCLLSSVSCSYVHTIHTSGIYYENRTLWHWIKLKVEGLMFWICHTSVICVSEQVYQQCYKLFNHNVSLRYINNGIDTHYDDIKKSNLIDHTYINLVYVARLHPGKNHHLLIEAFSKMSNKNVRLYLLGDGELKDELIQLASEKGCDNIFFLGNRSDVKEILSSCQIGLFPSLFEGFGLALLEMMAAGLPIICSDIPTFRKLMNPDDAIFFNPQNASELTDRIESLVQNKKLMKSLSKKSKEIASHYSVNRMGKEYLEIYKQLSK